MRTYLTVGFTTWALCAATYGQSGAGGGGQAGATQAGGQAGGAQSGGGVAGQQFGGGSPAAQITRPIPGAAGNSPAGRANSIVNAPNASTSSSVGAGGAITNPLPGNSRFNAPNASGTFGSGAAGRLGSQRNAGVQAGGGFAGQGVAGSPGALGGGAVSGGGAFGPTQSQMRTRAGSVRQADGTFGSADSGLVPNAQFRGMYQFDQNTPQRPNPAELDAWRFANHNGTWWYWMPGDYWVTWNGNAWNRYTPPAATTAARIRHGMQATLPVNSVPNFQ